MTTLDIPPTSAGGVGESMMQKSKVIAVAVALVAASAAVAMLAGSAAAAEWHVYEGDVYAGHAYGLTVPAGAESFEVLLDGGDASAANVAVFAPSGEKLGFYTLGADVSAAAFIEPAAGRHVLYVYDVTDGALEVRVNSEDAPPLALQKIPLAREDVEIAQGDGAALDLGKTVTLNAAPVFMTLLYEGSVTDLDATIASDAGDVVTITDESGTAFSPGVWSSLTGTRASEAANLGGTIYTVTATASSFEGTMTLTTLALDLSAPDKTPVPPMPKRPARDAPEVVPPAPEVPTSAFVVDEGTAVEFLATAGELILFDPQTLEEAAEADETQAADEESNDEDETDEGEESDEEPATPVDEEAERHISMVVSIYAPDDSLVAYVNAHDAEQRVELPVDGAYVMYVHHATDGAIAARLAESDATGIRELQLATEELEFYTVGSEAVTFDLRYAPVALTMRQADNAIGAFEDAWLENELGTVATSSTTAQTLGFYVSGWGDVYPENFAAGEHTLYTSSLLPTGVEIVSISYHREALPVPEEAAEEEAAADVGTAGFDLWNLFG